MIKYKVLTEYIQLDVESNIGIEILELHGRNYVELQGEELLIVSYTDVKPGVTVQAERIPMPSLYPNTNISAIPYLEKMGKRVYLLGSLHDEVLTPMGFYADKLIAPLLIFLYEQGYPTRYSCQGNVPFTVNKDNENADDEQIALMEFMARQAYIMFSNYDGVEYLAHLLAEFGYDGFHASNNVGDFVVRFDPSFLSEFTVVFDLPQREYVKRIELLGE